MWLLANGYKVATKGRIPAELMRIYNDRNREAAETSADRDGADVQHDAVDGMAEVEDAPGLGRKPKKVKRTSCGFCSVNTSYRHKYCPGTIKQGKLGTWTCWCYEKGHTL